MSVIDTFPPVKYLGDGRWRLEGDFVYQTRFGKLIVPETFETDFASVPPLPLSYLLCKNASVVAAAAHDWMYRQGEIAGQPITREQADNIMMDIMIDENVSWLKRHMIRFGLRIGGWWTWNNYRDDDPEAGFV